MDGYYNIYNIYNTCYIDGKVLNYSISSLFTSESSNAKISEIEIERGKN